ncbi:relaxase/mobilization nuclease domain-containing protein [Bacteroides fragilis]|uniref:conjugal transfer protein MobB n=1 Tax=Bacteroides fragilis TaxID=817 RepID=UPI00202E4DB3|nr:conjugal transfer protein MobB [Bacteroides fragilis]MCM0238801.1 relaxase/mobilization nuclease domain-containing protein [Bacteroides fragilis]
MVAKISVGNSLYGALAYNGEKINKDEGKLLATNRIFDAGTGKVDISRAADDFRNCMPAHVRTRNTVIHISLNPHPDDKLTDVELENLACEYMEKLGYGNQPYMVYLHEDIERHHLHVVSLNVDEKGKRLNKDYLFRRSKRITRDMEQRYGLHMAERSRRSSREPVQKVDVSKGDVKKQVANTVKSLAVSYRFQSMGEYRALLSLYNVTVEEARGEVDGREYHGLVYSATDDKGSKVGNPFKASRIGKSAGYEAIAERFTVSGEQIKEKDFTVPTKRTVLAVLNRTFRRDEFVKMLKEKGIDTVLRETDTGRIYGATFIDHRTGCVLNGSRMGKELSANALQEHFTLPFAGEQLLPFTLPAESAAQDEPQQQITASDYEEPSGSLGLFTSGSSGTDAAEDAFARELKRKKKKKNQRKI